MKSSTGNRMVGAMLHGVVRARPALAIDTAGCDYTARMSQSAPRSASASAAATLLIATPDPQALLADCPLLGPRLARADASEEAFLAIEDWLLAIHGVAADAEPALAAAAAGLIGRGHGWLRVDALTLVVSRDRLIALPQAAGDASDAARLIDALLPQLPRIGVAHALGEARLVDLDAPTDARLAPAWRTANRPLDSHLPDGPRGPDWRRWLTEAQMLLHEHPLNSDRESRGLRPLNALWLSGGAAVATQPVHRAVGLHGQHALARTLPVAVEAATHKPAITVWLHQPGEQPPATVLSALRRGSFRLDILAPSLRQSYLRQPWHALRVWRQPLRALVAAHP